MGKKIVIEIPKIDQRYFIGGMLLLLALLSFGSMLNVQKSLQEKEPVLKLFIMSHCPFGRRAVLQVLVPLIEKNPELSFEPHYIFYKRGDKLVSMHGEEEFKDDLREICIRDIYGPKAWLEYVKCFYSGGDREVCARNANIDWEKIETCAKDEKLAEKEYELTSKLGISASPTFVIGNATEVGLKPISYLASKYPELGVKFEVENITLLMFTPPNCPDWICNADELVKILENNFGVNVKVERVNKNASFYPSFYFLQSIENTDFFGQISRYLVKEGNLYWLRYRPRIYMLARPEVKNKLDLFVMSKCPFGNAAIKDVSQIVNKVPINVSVHYILYNQSGKLVSMHGEGEKVEDLRQLCIAKLYPQKLWNYLSCASSNYRTIENAWRTCAEKANISVSKVETCVNESEELLVNDSKLAMELGFTGSPTYLINNRYVLTGYQGRNFLNIYCELNGIDCSNITINESLSTGGGAC